MKDWLKKCCGKIRENETRQGSDMAIIGIASIIQALMNLGLIDEYPLLVHSVVLGSRKRLFKKLKAALNAKRPIPWKAR